MNCTWNTQTTLLFTLILHSTSDTHLLHTQLRDNSLLIQLPIYIRRTTLPLFTLYRAESFKIPYDSKSANNNTDKLQTKFSYTQIALDRSYIAVSDENYVSFEDKPSRTL